MKDGTLLRDGKFNAYVPLAMEIILAHEKGQSRRQAFCFTLNQGKRLFGLTQENRHRVLCAGFDMLNELPEKNLHLGYGVARRLGFILKIGGEFAPDPQKYKGEHGLRQEFFADTVRNATKWYLENKSLTQGN